MIPALLLGHCLFLVLNLVFNTALLLFFYYYWLFFHYYFLRSSPTWLSLDAGKSQMAGWRCWWEETRRNYLTWCFSLSNGDAGEKKLSHLMFFLLKWQDGWWVENICLDAFPVQKAMLMIKNLSSSPTPSNVQFLLKGILPQKIFSRPNLLFWIVMRCRKARLVRGAQKTPKIENTDLEATPDRTSRQPARTSRQAAIGPWGNLHRLRGRPQW